MSEMCPYYRTGRKCINDITYCCEREHLPEIGKFDCMSELYYSMDLENQLQQSKTENKHLNDLLNQALKEKEILQKQLADKHLDYESEYNRKVEEKGYRVFLEQKLKKIKEILETTCWDYTDITVTKVKDDILQIISEVEEWRMMD